MYRTLVGYRRPFASLPEAKLAVARYENGGHEHAENVKNHLGMYRSARPSDYAALFYLRPILPGVSRIFDLGGNAGNLFYSYSRYLEWPAGLRWQVLDLSANMATGEAIARERGASQLEFTGEWREASGANVLIVSGALHYFERPLAKMIAELEQRPAYILINRTPLTEGMPVATIQDLGIFRVACVVINRTQLIRGLNSLGYEVVDEWQALELSLEIPGYPEYTIPAYSGLFLQLLQASDPETKNSFGDHGAERMGSLQPVKV